MRLMMFLWTEPMGRRAPLHGWLRAVAGTWLAGLILLVPHAAQAQASAAAQPAPGHADDVDTEPTGRPWSANVSRDQRVEARELFLEGNRLLRIPRFAQAAEKYEAALKLWPHPAFHYNLAIAQINLVQPIEAHGSLAKALRYGAAPFEQDKYDQALEYQKRLEQQLGRIEITCAEPEAEVTLDGRLIFTGPRTREIVVTQGQHQVVARKAGRLTETEMLTVSAGQLVRVQMVLYPPDAVTTERYLPAWLPWTGLAASVASLSAAGYLDWRSARAIKDFDDKFEARCPTRGCKDDEVPELIAELDRAETERQVALGMYIGGGIAVIGSAVLIYVNRERIVRRSMREEAISFIPVYSLNSFGFTALIRF